MRQQATVPNRKSPCRLFVENAPRLEIGLIGTGQGNDQIDDRAAVEHIPDRAKHAIGFSKGPESIDINGDKRGCLKDQLFVGHYTLPRPVACDDNATVCYLTDAEKNIFVTEQNAEQLS